MLLLEILANSTLWTWNLPKVVCWFLSTRFGLLLASKGRLKQTLRVWRPTPKGFVMSWEPVLQFWKIQGKIWLCKGGKVALTPCQQIWIGFFWVNITWLDMLLAKRDTNVTITISSTRLWLIGKVGRLSRCPKLDGYKTNFGVWVPTCISRDFLTDLTSSFPFRCPLFHRIIPAFYGTFWQIWHQLFPSDALCYIA